MKAMQEQMADVQRELQNLQHEPPPNNADVQREMQKMQKQIAQLHMKRAVDQLRETARTQFANLTSQVTTMHKVLSSLVEDQRQVEAQLRAELQQDGASQPLEQLRTELQQVHSRQGDLDAAIKDLLAQHNKLDERLDARLNDNQADIERLDNDSITLWDHCARLESDIYTEEEKIAVFQDGWLRATDESEVNQTKSEPLIEARVA